ncbi:MAG TPA: F0F1 ATP synthase subunit delta [Rhodobacteraceae bacterium]|nr:F0F1 ATP synthase subunit delta [Paracoccaceae bacterium]HBG97709.1 F0F1 ATP synthase subunit delta [Paracoccaceae bacterium]
MTESASLSAGIADRYATALFELAREAGTIDRLESDMDALAAALRDSDDLRNLTDSPLYPRAATARAIMAVALAMNLSELTTSTLGLMAQKGRMFVLGALIGQTRRRIAEHRGEIAAEIVSAAPLTDDQRARLEQVLRGAGDRTVRIEARVDESLIGGLIVRLGSRMIDTTIASRLARLQNAIKEVG